MLVFFSYPYGSTAIEGKIIYGYLEKRDPVRISWEAFRKYSKSLIMAPYSKPLLEKMFPGSEFPNLSFTYAEIRYLDWEQMCSLCKAFGLKTKRSNVGRRKDLKNFLKLHC